MNHSDLIPFSETIVSLGVAGCRSATSRAYYGAFHATLKLLDDFQCALPKRTSHHEPPVCLQISNHASAKTAGDLLNNLQARRVKADYRLDELASEEKKYGETSIGMAKRIELLLSEFRAACNADIGLKNSFCASVKAYIDRKGGH